MSHFILRGISFIIICSIISCATNPYSDTNKVHKQQSKKLTKELNTFPPKQLPQHIPLSYGDYWAGTTNFNLRKPNYVIIHHTAQDSVGQTLNTFTSQKAQVSAHYVIGKDGKIWHMLNDYYRAWHGGIGKWGNVTDINSASIGIELDNNGEEEFSKFQIESLIQLLGILKEKYKIPAANFIGHSDIAPTRKVDPNAFFPWELLAENGFGLWYDKDLQPEVAPQDTFDNKSIEIVAIARDTTAKVNTSKNPLNDTVSPELALRIIGYDTSNLDAAIKAFKLHFIQTEVNSKLTERDKLILNNLYKKYL
jgi:N-acetylmuramoyl-L-alanine amidase